MRIVSVSYATATRLRALDGVTILLGAAAFAAMVLPTILWVLIDAFVSDAIQPSWGLAFVVIGECAIAGGLGWVAWRAFRTEPIPAWRLALLASLPLLMAIWGGPTLLGFTGPLGAQAARVAGIGSSVALLVGGSLGLLARTRDRQR